MNKRTLALLAAFGASAIYGINHTIAKDLFRILACAFFGMVINMLMSFKGLSLSAPINSAVMITISIIASRYLL